MRNPILTSLLLLVASLLGVGCGGAPPKTAEMNAFEESRQNGYAHAVVARYPKLAQESDAHYAQAVEANDDGDAEETLHHARMANMLWLTAVYQSQAVDERGRAVN